MYSTKNHTLKSDEVAHLILMAYENKRGNREKTRGLSRAWVIVTGAKAFGNGKPTRALVNQALAHRKRYEIPTPSPRECELKKMQEEQ